MVLEIFTPGFTTLPKSGQSVKVEGLTVGKVGVQVVARSVALTASKKKQPGAEFIHVNQLADAPDELPRFVEVEGVVRQFRQNPSGLTFELRDRGHLLAVEVLNPGDLSPADLQFARIKIRGVATSLHRLGIRGGSLVLIANEMADLTFVDDRHLKPFETSPMLDTRSFLSLASNQVWTARPRLAGKVSSVSRDSGGFQLSDAAGTALVIPITPAPVRVGDLVDAVGFVEPGTNGNHLSWAVVRISDVPDSAGAAAKPVPVLTDCETIRNLSTAALDARPPVRLTGVITYHDEARRLLFINDSEAGIQVFCDDYQTNLTTGMRLRVDGHAEGGRFAPHVVATHVEALGTGKYPVPVEGRPNRLMAGRLEATWVTLEGIVRSVALKDSRLSLHLFRSGQVFPVVVDQFTASSITNMADARVELRGVAHAVVNPNGQITGCRILVPDPSLLNVHDPAPADPFTVRRRKIGSFLTFDPNLDAQRLHSVEGIVTLSWPGQLFVNDESGNLEAVIARTVNVRAGDRVIVAGFPVLGVDRPILEDATVKFLGHETIPPATHTYAERILTHELNGRRATINGTLLSKTIGVRDYTLMLEDGDITVPVILRRRMGPVALDRFEVGCRLEATGICDLYGSDGHGSREVRLLADSADHLAVLEPPPFWNTNRMLIAVAVLAALVALLLLRQILLARRIAVTQSRFATALRASPVPVAIVTRGERRVLDVNLSFERQFEFSRRQLINRTFTEVGIFREASLMERIEKGLSEGRSVRALDCRLQSSSGAERHVLLSAESIDVDGETCLLFIFQDVTERLELMNQLRDSQKLEAVGQLAAGVAHDFNNLLTIIRGNCDVLKEIAREDTELEEVSEEIDAATSRAADLTRQLLAFSRKQIMQPRILDLNIVVAGAMKMLKRLLGGNIIIHSELVGDEIPVFADAGMLDQVLVNLAVNARDAMVDGGEVMVATHLRHFCDDDAPLHPEASVGTYVELRVTDTGSGMPPETLQRIFEPFFTTKEVGKGTGLGLATVYGIVKQHRGWIEVDSEEGEGTTFRVFLPIAETKSSIAAPTPIHGGTRLGSETVLLVEDEPAVRRMVAKTLERAGYTVLAAENGVRARTLWKQHEDKVDLLLTDVVMPGGVSGRQLAAELRRSRPALHLVYMSGFKFEESDAVTDGVFIAKPFTKLDLLSTIRTTLDEKTFAG